MDNYKNKIEEILESFKDVPVRQEHLDCLCDAFFDELQWDSSCEFGAWGMDCKRPFGNSDRPMICADISEIIGNERDMIFINDNADLDEEYCDYLCDLYYDLGYYLKWRWRKLTSKL